MVKARYHRSAGLRLPAPRLNSSRCLGSTPLPTPPSQRRGLRLGRGFERLRQGVGRCGQLAVLPIDDYARLPVRFVDSMIHDGDIIDLSALVLMH